MNRPTMSPIRSSSRRSLVLAAAASLTLAGGGQAIAHDGHREYPVSTATATTTSSTIPTPTYQATKRFVGLVAPLSGSNEVGIQGSPTSAGAFALTLDTYRGRISFRQLDLRNVLAANETAPLNLHIHRGIAGENGPVVVDFTAEASDGDGRGSVNVDAGLVTEIARYPERFYVNLHTNAFVKGAVRGQLTPKPQARFGAVLSGANEVDTVGDADGSGTLALAFAPRRGLIAFGDLRLANVIAPEGEAIKNLHIHRGLTGQNGPVVVDLTDAAIKGGGKGIVSAPSDLIREIRHYPERFYVNVHTDAFGKGAVRGQISDLWG